jgi:hypothetical protein
MIELLSCPFCGGSAKEMVGLIGCERCAIARRDAQSWNRRATPSPSQAGPEDVDDVWPIVNVTVDEDGKVTEAKLYAPGLPPGNHDVYPVRVPYMDEHTEAWLAVAKVLQEVAPGYLDGSGNGIECAVKAIRRLATPSPGKAEAERDAARLDYLDKYAVMAKAGQPIREAIDAAMEREGRQA